MIVLWGVLAAFFFLLGVVFALNAVGSAIRRRHALSPRRAGGQLTHSW